VREELERAELPPCLERLPNGISGFLAVFFTRDTGRANERKSTELTHKSFAEYLYTRRLVRQIKALAALAPAGLTVTGVDDFRWRRLAEWVRLTGTHRMTVEILDWLRRELVDQAEVKRGKWHRALTPILAKLWRDDWRDDPHDNTQRGAERRSVNAEEALFCCWQALWQSASACGGSDCTAAGSDGEMDRPGCYWSFPHDGIAGWHALCRRLEAVHGIVSGSPFLRGLQHADWGARTWRALI